MDPVLIYLWYNRRQRNQSRQWVHPINRLRAERSVMKTLYVQLRNDEQKFENYARMSTAAFDELLGKVHLKLKGLDTNCRHSIDPSTKLLVTLRHLATGESFVSLHYQFRLGETTVSRVIGQVCDAIWETLQVTEMPVPDVQGFKNIAEKFQSLWQFPNCVGSVDGKHIRVKCPSKSGSLYYNYKQFFSIVLQGVADAEGCFIAIDIGDYGRHHDAAVFKHSAFGRAVMEKSLQLPQPQDLPNSQVKAPFVFIGDEAYPLLDNLLRPYPRRDLDNRKRIYNYRHSRARRSVECAFGMMTSKFQCLAKQLNCQPATAAKIVKACCVLHNFIRRRDGKEYSPPQCEPAEQRNMATNLAPINQRPSSDMLSLRENYTEFFVSEAGKLPWQEEHARVRFAS